MDTNDFDTEGTVDYVDSWDLEGEEENPSSKYKIENLSEEEFEQLFRDTLDKKVFLSDYIYAKVKKKAAQELLKAVFIPLAAGALAFYENKNDIGMVFEYLENASDKTINGFPMFLSVNALTTADANKLRERLREERAKST